MGLFYNFNLIADASIKLILGATQTHSYFQEA
jgi:hypothetical protein